MKLSVITINFNNTKGLEKTLNSIVNQSFKDYEFIVIDGGSTDGSVDIIKQYADKISYWISEPDNGIYNAMNKGISKANGEYIHFLNSGDWFVDSLVLERIFSVNRVGDVLYGDYYYIQNNNTTLFKYPEKLHNFWFYTGTLCHQAVFVKAKHQTKYMFDESLRFVADWKVLYTLFIKDKCFFEYLNMSVSYYTLDGFSSKSENIEQLNKERLGVLKQEFLPATLQTELDIVVKCLKLTDSQFNVYISSEDRIIGFNGRIAIILRILVKICNKLFN